MKLESLPFDLCSAVAEANRIYFLDTDIRTLEFAHQIAAKNIRVTRSMEPKEQRNTEQQATESPRATEGPWDVVGPELLSALKQWIALETAHGDRARIPAAAIAAVDKAEGK